MSSDSKHPYASITPVDPPHANRVLNRWSLLCTFVVAQTLGALYGVSCCLLPMLAGQGLGAVIGAGFEATLALALLFALCGAAAGLIGLSLFGFPVLLIERRICDKFLRSIDGRDFPGVSPSDCRSRVVECVPRGRWKKRICLETATDVMIIAVDHRGVWMQGDRYRYDLPGESILGAECESFSPPGCSFEISMVTIFARTEDGTIELPISYRDYRWADFQSCHRRAQAMDLADQINSAAKGHRCRSPEAPTAAHGDCPTAWQPSNNPYASPALIDDSSEHDWAESLQMAHDVVGKNDHHQHQ